MSPVSRAIETESAVKASGPRTDPPALLSEKVQSLRISHTPEPPPSRGGFAWFLCLLLASSTGYLAWQLYVEKPATAVAEPTTAGQAPAAAGETPAATKRLAARGSVADSGGVVLESKGYVIPTHQILLSPKVSGMVKYLRVRRPDQPADSGIPLIEGLRVEQGDVLAQLESTDYEADVARSKAARVSAELRLEMERKNVPNEIEQATAELNEAISNRDYLKTVLDRNRSLAKTSAVSPVELQKSESEHTGAVHRVEQLARALELISGPQAERIKVAEADVSAARAEQVKAEWRLGNCLIAAPIAGTILKKNVEEGNIVNPVAFNGSYSVCEMADLSDLEVDLSIQERDISRVFVGQRCVVRAEAYPERAYDGVVSRLMPIADRAKGAVPVRVKISVPADENGAYLKPEMGAVVSFYGKETQPH